MFPLTISAAGIVVCLLTFFVATHIKPVKREADIESERSVEEAVNNTGTRINYKCFFGETGVTRMASRRTSTRPSNMLVGSHSMAGGREPLARGCALWSIDVWDVARPDPRRRATGEHGTRY